MSQSSQPPRHQPSGPGATGGLPGANADPDVVQFTPDEAASTVAMGSEAPVGETGGRTGMLRQEQEVPPVVSGASLRGADDASVEGDRPGTPLDATEGTAEGGEDQLPGDQLGTESFDAEELQHTGEAADEGLSGHPERP
jgi:hypothetical protein